MEFIFHTRLDDLNVCLAMVRASAGRKRASVFSLLAILACLAFLAVRAYDAVCNAQAFFEEETVNVFLLLLLFVIIRWGDLRRGRFAGLVAKKMYKKADRGRAQDVRFTEDEIYIMEPYIEKHMRYGALTRLTDSGGCYVLFTAPSVGFPLDKKSVSGGELAGFERLLQEKTGLTLERVGP